MIKSTSLLGLLLLFFSCSSWAQELSIKQRFLMPDEVIQGHAKFEAQCEKCHAAFEKEEMPKLCIGCHEEIAADRKAEKGFHGQGPQSSHMPCNTCHTDHLGRNADIIGIQIDVFDHSWTRFPLEGEHGLVECAGCHEPGEKYRKAEPECVSCHKTDDFHKGNLGEECSDCHQPTSWQKRKPFDHSSTHFPLEGMHKEAHCTGCHANQVYEFEEKTCVSCHKAADRHAGKNGPECETCHSVDGWDKRTFDHSKTHFPLRFAHDDIPCRACHKDGIVKEKTSTDCQSCHKNDDIHLGRNGTQCQSCHKTEAWKKVKFDHFAKTEFPLQGKHKELACTHCHVSALKEELPRDCASCHGGDDPHKSPSMQMCGTCHMPDSWKVTNQFDHQLAAFPLVGMHQLVPCQSCHIRNQFTGTESNCVSCHKSEDHHKGALGTECSSCHSPNSWKLWQFDHDMATDFKLTGTHEGLACVACHTSDGRPEDTSPVCASCHGHQDIHNGAFGKDCGSCHSKDTFRELILQDMKR